MYVSLAKSQEWLILANFDIETFEGVWGMFKTTENNDLIFPYKPFLPIKH